jgi:beta-N-acetylhexosaminidase
MTATEEIENKVGQLITLGIPGTKLEGDVLHTLMRIAPGGVILFKHNYQDLAQLIELNNALQKNLQPQCYQKWPLWISVDQEGGRVQRFKEPFTVFPPQGKWGVLNSPKTCFEAGFVLARELKVAGVNTNFSPVIDVLQVEAKAIGDRAFSSDPNIVAALGSATVRGLQKGGVLAVAKHFPGHGAVVADSHEELPICNKSIEELEEVDWVPFRKAIRSRCEGIMVAHVLFPKLDPDKPASLSRKIVQDQLRKNLRYTKLVFTDDMEMGALKDRYELKEAAFLAIEAGCDQLIFGHEWEKVEDIKDHLVKAFRDGVLPMSRLAESLERIQEAKQNLQPYRAASRTDAAVVVGSQGFRDVAEMIAQGKIVENGPSTLEEA